MIKVARLYDQFSLFNELESQDDFNTLVNYLTPTVIEELDNCFLSTKMILSGGLDGANCNSWPEEDVFTSMVPSC